MALPAESRQAGSLPALLRGVDRGAFTVALSLRLRAAGMAVGLTNIDAFTRALGAGGLGTRSGLYWAARTTLLRRYADLETFDTVFGAVFDGTGLGLDPHARRDALPPSDQREDPWAQAAAADAVEESGGGLPWTTLPTVTGTAGSDEGQGFPLRLPSDVETVADVPFEDFAEEDLAVVDTWIRSALPRWPVRRSRRLGVHRAGRRVALRSTLQRARRTGWEPVELVRSRAKTKPRKVVMLCDVSQSMQAHAFAYLHLMRVAALLTPTEVFAFATELTRLTAVLAHRSPQRAVELATEKVGDRFGGTRIASNLGTLLRSRHGIDLRGAVVVIASDGWDSDEATELEAVMRRLRRRAHTIIWVNPRAAAPGFAPLVGGMAAALPYCDQMLPGHNLRALGDVVSAVTLSARPQTHCLSSTGSHGSRGESGRG